MLTPEQESAAREASAKLDESALTAQKAADDASSGVSGWFAGAIGADSTVNAVRSEAAAQANLARVMRDKLPRVLERGDPDEVRRFVVDCGQYADVSNLLATVSWLKPTTAVVEVGSATLKDVGKAASDATSTAKWLLPVVVVGLLAVVALRFMPARRA